MNKTISVLLYLGDNALNARKCLDSLLSQSYKDIELIVIDDAPEDLEKYFSDEKYSPLNMTVIKHSERLGFYRSISEGLEAASGEHVGILDSGVSLPIDFYRILYKKMSETDSDIAISDIGKYTDTKKYFYDADTLRYTDYESEKYDLGEIFKAEGNVSGIYSLHNKLFKKAVLEKAFVGLPKADVSAVIFKLFFVMNIFANAKRICNTHSAAVFFDDTFSPVDAGADIRREAAGFEMFSEHFAGYDIDRERIAAFALSFYLSYFFFGKCFKEDIIKKLVKEALKLKAPEIDICYEKMLGIFSMTTDITEPFAHCENIKSFICDPNVRCFGFDIFDTLVVRPFFKPTDLFCCLNNKFKELIADDFCVDFALIRREGEMACRRHYNVVRPFYEDVSLREIYDFISKKYGIDKIITDAVMQYEMELELRFIQPRNFGRELFELAQYMNKTVFIASDMYLPEEHIEKMLKKCGYENYRLYLSNSLGKSKCSGKLYKHILKDLNIDISAEKAGFIGDNPDADVKASQKNGFTGFHLPKTTEIFMNADTAYFKQMTLPDGTVIDNAFNALEIRSMAAVAANKIFDCPYISVNRDSDLKFIGYFICGMLLYGKTRGIFDSGAMREKILSGLPFVRKSSENSSCMGEYFALTVQRYAEEFVKDITDIFGDFRDVMITDNSVSTEAFGSRDSSGSKLRRAAAAVRRLLSK